MVSLERGTLAWVALALVLGAGMPGAAVAQGVASAQGAAVAQGDGSGGRAPPDGRGGEAPSDGNVSGGREHQPSQATVATRESRAGIGTPDPTRQDRDLDAIGKQLLDQTPKSPAGSTLQTGGGTTP